MSGRDGVGTGGSVGNASHLFFPSVPYGPGDFNKKCSINDHDEHVRDRNCELMGLKDLDQVRALPQSSRLSTVRSK
jgi:hypothetical protein